MPSDRELKLRAAIDDLHSRNKITNERSITDCLSESSFFENFSSGLPMMHELFDSRSAFAQPLVWAIDAMKPFSPTSESGFATPCSVFVAGWWLPDVISKFPEFKGNGSGDTKTKRHILVVDFDPNILRKAEMVSTFFTCEDNRLLTADEARKKFIRVMVAKGFYDYRNLLYLYPKGGAIKDLGITNQNFCECYHKYVEVLREAHDLSDVLGDCDNKSPFLHVFESDSAFRETCDAFRNVEMHYLSWNIFLTDQSKELGSILRNANMEVDSLYLTNVPLMLGENEEPTNFLDHTLPPRCLELSLQELPLTKGAVVLTRESLESFEGELHNSYGFQDFLGHLYGCVHKFPKEGFVHLEGKSAYFRYGFTLEELLSEMQKPCVGSTIEADDGNLEAMTSVDSDCIRKPIVCEEESDNEKGVDYSTNVPETVSHTQASPLDSTYASVTASI